MEQRRHYAVERLSDLGRTVVLKGLETGDTYDEIIAAVRTATGEKLAPSSLQRYYAKKWLPERRRLEKLHATAEAEAALGKNEE